jgi:hypothetical protein
MQHFTETQTTTNVEVLQTADAIPVPETTEAATAAAYNTPELAGITAEGEDLPGEPAGIPVSEYGSDGSEYDDKKDVTDPDEVQTALRPVTHRQEAPRDDEIHTPQVATPAVAAGAGSLALGESPVKARTDDGEGGADDAARTGAEAGTADPVQPTEAPEEPANADNGAGSGRPPEEPPVTGGGTGGESSDDYGDEEGDGESSDGTGADSGSESDIGESREVPNEILHERVDLINSARRFAQQYGQPVTVREEDALEVIATQALNRDEVLPPDLEIGHKAEETLVMDGAHVILETQALGPEIMPFVEELELAGEAPIWAHLTVTVIEASSVDTTGNPSVVASIYVQRTTPPTMILEVDLNPMAEGTASRQVLTMLGLHEDDISQAEYPIHYPDVDDLLSDFRSFVQGFTDRLPPPNRSVGPDDFSDPE